MDPPSICAGLWLKGQFCTKETSSLCATVYVMEFLQNGSIDSHEILSAYWVCLSIRQYHYPIFVFYSLELIFCGITTFASSNIEINTGSK